MEPEHIETDHMRQGILIYDKLGVISYLNPVAEDLLAKAGADLVGLSVLTLSNDADNSYWLQSGTRRVIHTWAGAVYLITSDLPGGGILAEVLSPRISDSMELQALLHEMEAIFDSSSDEIFVADGNGVCLRVNAACERFYGIKASELIGRNVDDLEREQIFNPSVTRMVLKERKVIRMVQTTRTGRRIVATSNPVFDQSGTIIRVVTNARDITDLVHLRDHLVELEELNARHSQELAELRQEVTRLPGLVVNSAAMRQVEQMVRKVAGLMTTVLLLGESGVGKNAISKAIHLLGPRRGNPFIAVNCGAIPEPLLESELFGYDPGAFTGARREGKVGLIELANGGTLFLNEIGDLPMSLQVKLLDLIQERKVTRVGGTKVLELDLRIIAATHRDLKAMVRDGSFREDLFYRLHVIPIRIPPLRERLDDIPDLLKQQLERLSEQHGIARRFSGASIQVLLGHAWLGNVREFQNVIERIVVTSDDEVISASFVAMVLGNEMDGRSSNNPTLIPPEVDLRTAADKVERDLLTRSLQEHGSTYKVARALGVSQSTVVRKLRRFGIRKPSQL